jgi:hypothetical protein
MRREAEEAHVLSALLDAWTSIPALVYDRHLDVLAANVLANRVLRVRAGDNLVRATFLADDVHRGTEAWNGAAAAVVGALRESLDAHVEDDAFLELVGELAATSAQFPQFWADAAHGGTSGEVDCIVGGEVIALRYTKLIAQALPTHTVLVWHPVDAAARHVIRVRRGDR